MIASVLRLARCDCAELGIRDAYGIHKAVYDLFPKNEGGIRDFLFVDTGGGFDDRQILILSSRKPSIPRRGTIEMRELPDQFLSFSRYAFEIRLNAVKREKGSGKIVPIRGRDELLAWFTDKAPSWGFVPDADSLSLRRTGIQSFDRAGSLITQSEALFVGKLTVSDRDIFTVSFEKGIGRGKGFGFGLLQILPLRD